MRASSTRYDTRARLRESTAAVHQRLHNHAGFAAVAQGTIRLDDYRRLLARLWGFHYPFEKIFRQVHSERALGVELEARARSSMLTADLVSLGVNRGSLSALPQCAGLRAPKSAAEFMGALYVVEGSTLGGLHLARAVQPLLMSNSNEGRSFFLGYGNHHGAMWRAFLAALDNCVRSEGDKAAAVGGATETFSEFEIWMNGWNDTSTTDAATHAD
jgi:heme oxygenase